MIDSFNYKDVLFSFRQEYLKNKNELEKLKKLVYCDTKIIDNFYFWINKWNNDMNPEIMCNIKKKKEFIKRHLENLRDIIKGNYKGLNFKMLCDNNHNYYLQDSSIPMHVFLENQEAFYTKVQSILASDFANKMFFKKIIGDRVLMAEPLFINYTLANDGNISYSVLDDTITFNIDHGKISNQLIEKMFNSQISKSTLPDYQKGIMENSNMLGKKIKLDNDIENLASVKYCIKEDGGKFLIKKFEKKIC